MFLLELTFRAGMTIAIYNTAVLESDLQISFLKPDKSREL